MTLWVAAGIALSAGGATLTYGSKPNWGIDILCFMVSIFGIFLALGSDVPILSLLGYAMVAGPFGVILGPVVALYTKASLVKVLGTTFLLSVGLGGIGVIYPKSLGHWSGYLLGALWLLILAQFATLFLGAFGLPVEGATTLFDWIGIILFGGYTIYDMNRAMQVERTVDNSIDIALAVYLDFINLFVRLLELMGKKAD